jgi:hypothetical protein
LFALGIGATAASWRVKNSGAGPLALTALPVEGHVTVTRRAQKILGRFSVDRCFCQLAEEDIRFLFFLQILVEQCCRILQPNPSCPGFQSSVARYFVMFDCLSGREQTRIKRTAIFIIFDDFLASRAFLRSSFGRSVLITASPTITYRDSARDAFCLFLRHWPVSVRRFGHKPLARSAEKRQVSDKWIRLSARSITLRGPLGCVGSLKRHIGTCPISPRATEMLPPSRLPGLLTALSRRHCVAGT